MEIEELKTIWQKYDSKLDHLEKLNKKLIMDTLSRKPQKKLNWMKYRSLSAVFMAPVILILALQDSFKIENIDLKFVIGCLLTLLVIVYLSYVEFKKYKTLNGVDLSNDPIIESARKVSVFKSIVVTSQKYTFMTYPILSAGIILIGWKGFNFDMRTILFLSAIFIFTLIWGIIQSKRFTEKIERLVKEIHDLNEYAE